MGAALGMSGRSWSEASVSQHPAQEESLKHHGFEGQLQEGRGEGLSPPVPRGFLGLRHTMQAPHCPPLPCKIMGPPDNEK